MIKLDDTYYVDIDKFQFILKRKEIIKKGERAGEDIFYDEGYYGYNLERLLKKYIHLQLNGNFPDNISDLIFTLRGLEVKVEEIGQNLKKAIKEI